MDVVVRIDMNGFELIVRLIRRCLNRVIRNGLGYNLGRLDFFNVVQSFVFVIG